LAVRWDKETLAIELQALVDLDFEVELTGFEPARVDLILDGETENRQTSVERSSMSARWSSNFLQGNHDVERS
jgi:hypothetical protein